MKDPIAPTARRLLAGGSAVVIATIVNREGSVPRTAGTKMLVSPAESAGTIGGGLLEARVERAALEMLAGDVQARLLPFDLTRDDTAAMDMICGGRGSVLLDRFSPSEANEQLFERWWSIQKQRQTGWFLTLLAAPTLTGTIDAVTHGVLGAGDELWEGAPLPAEIQEAVTAAARRATALEVKGFDRLQAVIEPALRPTTVYLFGAGHVARPTVHLAALTGFRTEIVDDRSEFCNADRFPEADAVHVLADFQNACRRLVVDADSFMVIFTRGHHHDLTVLAQALATPAAYVGMIGSRRKRDLIFKALQEQGFGPDDLARIHTPIGLAIGAETPEEIAVSIVAELIQTRAAARQ